MNHVAVTPTFFAYLVVAGFPILGLLFDAFLPRHRAVLATLLTGFLFLPSIELDLGGALYWNRNTAPFFVIMFGVIFRDMNLLSQLRLRWFDLPILTWCLVPFAASVTSGLGVYDGIAQVFYQCITWGGPYLIGRLHFHTKEQLIDLARFLFWGGLIYVPLCLFEVRMSPVLHNFFYGFNQHVFIQSIRGSYYRPMVFLQHGLMVSMWVGMTTYIGWVLTSSVGGIRLFGLPSRIWPLLMLVTLLAMQSFGAVLLLFAAWAVTVFCKSSGGRTLLVLLALVPAGWAFSRSTSLLKTDTLASAASVISTDRAESLVFRLRSEDRLVRHAWSRPIFGWSPSGFNQIQTDAGNGQKVVADGLWIIAFSAYGVVGLLAMLCFHLVPFFIVLREAPPKHWTSQPLTWMIGSMGVIIAIVAVDNLMNAMINPLFLLMMGALPTVLSRPGWNVDEISPGNSDAPADESGQGLIRGVPNPGSPFGRQFGAPRK
jgi:hypothetical protein